MYGAVVMAKAILRVHLLNALSAGLPPTLDELSTCQWVAVREGLKSDVYDCIVIILGPDFQNIL